MAFAAPGVYVVEVPAAAAPIVGVGTSTPAFIGVWADPAANDPAGNTAAGVVVPCTSYTDFKTAFGDFSATVEGQNLLAHAVRGFFDNGGTFCYVVRAATEGDVAATALAKLESYDDIAMIAAPGLPADPTKPAMLTDLITHCANMMDRIAILDAPKTLTNVAKDLPALLPGGANQLCNATDFAALYAPWIQVFDPVVGGPKLVPPSGHVAGIYARVDATRGVHKAPANEQVLGAIGPAFPISLSQQATVNLLGGNCIRTLQGALKVWGARTLAGNTSLHKYVPIRRFLSFLYKSIDQGTQWAVFEPNGPDLWARIIRNVGSFLTSQWAAGALAGNVAQEAFYVKCDAENNPPDQRANGQLTVEVGVATVFPAEFVVFKIQQYTGPIK
jgi:phage tail sheath protein FI